jgi:hypothetical protein
MKVIPTAAVLGAEVAGVDLSRPLVPQRRLMHRTTMGGAVPAWQPRAPDQAACRSA